MTRHCLPRQTSRMSQAAPPPNKDDKGTGASKESKESERGPVAKPGARPGKARNPLCQATDSLATLISPHVLLYCWNALLVASARTVGKVVNIQYFCKRTGELPHLASTLRGMPLQISHQAAVVSLTRHYR